MYDSSIVARMVAYMAWANDVMLKNVEVAPDATATERHNSLFKSISGTFDHILLIAEIFLAHLEGRSHGHKARHRNVELSFPEVAQRLREIDQTYVRLVKIWTADELNETVRFQFVDGGKGEMSRADILLHLVNHATYHRGFISTLLYPTKRDGAANDFTVFLRDAWPNKSDATMEIVK